MKRNTLPPQTYNNNSSKCKLEKTIYWTKSKTKTQPRSTIANCGLTEGLMILLNTMCAYAIGEGLVINLKKSSAIADDNHEELTKFWEDHPLPLTLANAVIYLGGSKAQSL